MFEFIIQNMDAATLRGSTSNWEHFSKEKITTLIMTRTSNTSHNHIQRNNKSSHEYEQKKKS
jgi:hypothetical protein